MEAEEDEEDEEVEEDKEQAVWWEVMAVLLSLLPNLDVLRGGGWWPSPGLEDKILDGMLSSSSRSFTVISSLAVTSTNRSNALHLIERSSSTLRTLQTFGISSSEVASDPSDPTTVVTFPLLERISFYAVDMQESFPLPLSSSRWILPALSTLDTTVSPSLLPILCLHGSKLRQLGLRMQFDDQTYEECFDLCPNLETFAWEVWDPMEKGGGTQSVKFNFVRPVPSVRTITIAQLHHGLSHVDELVPKTVNRTNFPSLRRVSFGTSLEISDA